MIESISDIGAKVGHANRTLSDAMRELGWAISDLKSGAHPMPDGETDAQAVAMKLIFQPALKLVEAELTEALADIKKITESFK